MHEEHKNSSVIIITRKKINALRLENLLAWMALYIMAILFTAMHSNKMKNGLLTRTARAINAQ